MLKLRVAFIAYCAIASTVGCSLIAAPDESLLGGGGSDLPVTGGGGASQGGEGGQGAGQGLGGMGGMGGMGGDAGMGGDGGMAGMGGMGGDGGMAGMGGMGGDGGGGGPACDPMTCPGMDTDCTVRSCDAQDMCGFTDLPLDTVCDENGGVFCDGVGNCIECDDPSDCTDPLEPLCVANFCAPQHCNNMMFDPADGESDVDCGGIDCADCINGSDCNTFEDCESAFCDVGICAPCGGDTDCQAGSYCDSNSACVPKLPDGGGCTGNNECESDSCVDSVCCNVGCGGTCEACNVPGFEGACTPLAVGTDPDNECGGDVCGGASNCRCANGAQDGLETDTDCGGGVCGT